MSAVQYFWKLISIFYKDNPNKLMAISTPFATAAPRAKSNRPKTLATKQIRSWLTKTSNIYKHAKKISAISSLFPAYLEIITLAT